MFGERLKEARKMKGLSQEALAELVSVEKMSISKYESGKMMPSSTVLIELADALDVEIDYFFRHFTVRLESKPAFRASKLSAKAKKQIVAETQDTMERQLEILDICQCRDEYRADNSLRCEVFSYEDIERLSGDVRMVWGLGTDPIENLMDVSESHGFSIVLVDAPDSFDAVVFSEEEYGPIVALRRGAPKERQRFTLAHELGHYFILPESERNAGWDSEKMANRFAAAFLMPKELLISDIGEKRTSIEGVELSMLREKYGVSIPAILSRLESLKIITHTYKLRLSQLYAEGRFGGRERGDAYCDTESPLLLQKLVYRSLAESVISQRKACELLSVDWHTLYESLRAA